MQLPLLFTFKQPVFGNGFLAGVSMSGRALLDESNGETWITGVAPVGLAGGGVDRNAAFADFRKAWVEILFDVADETTSFADFKEQAEEFLSSASASMTQEWQAELDEVRRKNYIDPALRRESADGQGIAYQVVELTAQKYASGENEVEAGLQAAA